MNRNEKDFSSKLKRDKGIYDYETQTYTKEKNKNISTKEIRETIQEKDVRRNRQLKYDSEELDNSSFSYAANIKRYDDLSKTYYIEYFRKDDGF